MPSAGDVERFAYCHHNWWLAEQGIDPDSRGSRRGIEEHAEKGKALAELRELREYRQSIMRWAFRGLLALASVVLLILEVIYFEGTPQGIILVVMALVLVSATIGLFTIAVDQQRQEVRKREEAGIAEGDIIDDDLSGTGSMLVDDTLELRGTPDYILGSETGYIPVEVKTGKTPDEPYESHTLQLACYMHLLGANGHKRPPFGLLTYPKRIFQVDWTPELEAKLMATLEAMRAAKENGTAPRSHEHRGRCIGCARRDHCEVKLA